LKNDIFSDDSVDSVDDQIEIQKNENEEIIVDEKNESN